MPTDIEIKANEVIAWIDSGKLGRAPTPKEVKRYIEDRWPDITVGTRDDIAFVAMGMTF